MVQFTYYPIGYSIINVTDIVTDIFNCQIHDNRRMYIDLNIELVGKNYRR